MKSYNASDKVGAVEQEFDNIDDVSGDIPIIALQLDAKYVTTK